LRPCCALPLCSPTRPWRSLPPAEPLSAAAKRQTIIFASPQLDSFGVDSRFEAARSSSAFKFCALAVPETWDRATSHQSPDPTILRSAQERLLLNPPCGAAAFVVNSKPHTGARPSVRLCVGLTSRRRARASSRGHRHASIQRARASRVHWHASRRPRRASRRNARASRKRRRSSRRRTHPRAGRGPARANRGRRRVRRLRARAS
jgi:hypothetical protein